jgi:hypothetical protein
MVVANSYSLLAALQSFLRERNIDVQSLTVAPMIEAMIDWFRLVPLTLLKDATYNDVLVYRYGGWSEGCATGFVFSVLRRITEPNASNGATDWVAGITLMFEPSRYADLAPLVTISSDWQSIEAFLRAIESSPAYKMLLSEPPMSVLLESGGLR